MKTNIEDLQTRLLAANHKTRSPLIIRKTDDALTKIRRALTLIEQAEQTLFWAEHNIKHPLPGEN